MKKTIGIIIFSFIFLSLNAQTIYQNGVAREINSNKKPLVSVFIKFLNSNSTVSGDDGKFQLAFKNQKKGGDIFLEEIKKSGYELVNEKDFENIKISSDSLLGVNVILAQLGYVDAAKKEYYGVSDQALLAGFEKEKKALQAKFQATQLTGTELRTELNSLRKQYEEQKESLDALAERFARINFDDVEPTYKEALELFKAGKINKAIATLEATNPAARTHQIIAEEKRLDTAQKDLDQQKAKLATDKKKQIAAVRLLADMYSIQFNPLKAEQQYDDLLLLDSTDLEILIDASEFYKDQHRYDKAKKIFSKIINHPQVEPWQVANIHWYTGNIYFNTGDPAKALEAYTLFSKSHKKLVKENPNHSFYKEKLAISYSKLGESHSALGNMEKAFKYIEYATILFEKLYQTYPNNVEFKDGLAITYEKLGSVHSTRGDLDKAFNYYEKYNNLEKQLFKEYPNNVRFKNLLAISYQFLGYTHSDLGNLDKTLDYFEQFNHLEKQLFEEYPNNIEIKNWLAISYSLLARFHRDQKKDYKKAKEYFNQCYLIWKELSQTYPSYIEFKDNYTLASDALTELESLSNPITHLKFQIKAETDTINLYQLYTALCDTLRIYSQKDSDYQTDFVQALNSRAWYGFFLKKFKAVESDIREGMALDTNNKYLFTNLPPALLLQGKYDEALVEYQKYKDVSYGDQNLATYKDAFLDDLNAFEATGIIPPERMEGVKKIRDILNRK